MELCGIGRAGGAALIRVMVLMHAVGGGWCAFRCCGRKVRGERAVICSLALGARSKKWARKDLFVVVHGLRYGVSGGCCRFW